MAVYFDKFFSNGDDTNSLGIEAWSHPDLDSSVVKVLRKDLSYTIALPYINPNNEDQIFNMHYSNGHNVLIIVPELVKVLNPIFGPHHIDTDGSPDFENVFRTGDILVEIVEFSKLAGDVDTIDFIFIVKIINHLIQILLGKGGVDIYLLLTGINNSLEERKICGGFSSGDYKFRNGRRLIGIINHLNNPVNIHLDT